jgi:glycosyltransferase involved in cell wall biosynthesis
MQAFLGVGWRSILAGVRISVVICCSNDFDLTRAIDSVDEAVEIVATITPNRMIEDYLKMKGIPYAVTPVGNHAVTTNAGIESATGDAVLVIDSDTVLLPGTIARVRAALADALVVNVPIRFESEDRELSRLIARLRDFDNTYDQPAYKPGIAFRMDLREKVGGYFYDPSVAWPCDAELLGRLRASAIPITHLPAPGIVHRPISLRHLLRAYFHYGIGDARRISLLRQETHWHPHNLVARYRAAWAAARESRDPALLGLLVAADSMSLSGIVSDELLRRAGLRRVEEPADLTPTGVGHR